MGGLHQLSLCGVNVPWAAVQLALGEDPGVIEPPFLGQDYTVVSGARPLRPVSLPAQRMEDAGPLRPSVPAPAPMAAEVDTVEAAASALPL